MPASPLPLPPRPARRTPTQWLVSLVAFLSVPILITAGIAVVQYRLGNQVLPHYRLSQQSPSPSPTDVPVAPRYGFLQPRVTAWQLLRQQGEQRVEVFSAPISWSGPLLARWKNRLVFIQYQQPAESNTTMLVLGNNLETGVTEVMATYDLAELAATDAGIQVTDMMIDGDRLFVALSQDYVLESRVIWMDLEKRSAWGVLNTTHYPSFMSKGQQHFVLGGDGDGCGGTVSYYKFDLLTPGLTFLSKSNNGCVMGNRVIGLTDQALYQSSVEPQPNDMGMGMYQTVEMLDIKTGRTSSLLGRQQMPPMIRHAKLDPTNQTIWLFGDQLYRFDIISKTLSQMGGLPDLVKNMELAYETIDFEGDDLCFFFMGPNGSERRFVEFSPATGLFTMDAPNCPLFKAQKLANDADVVYKQKVRTALRELELPAEYQMEFKTTTLP